MNLMVYAILFQVCGNNLVFIENGQPTFICHTITQKCDFLDIYQLAIIRNTSRCSKLKPFQALE